MREIKFRAWNKDLGKMCDSSTLQEWMYEEAKSAVVEHDLQIEREKTPEKEYEHLIFMQYTGLKDINEEMVYEGDICLMQLKDTVVEGEITYRPPCFILNTNSDSWDLDNYYSIKIIGNIFENPDLASKL